MAIQDDLMSINNLIASLKGQINDLTAQNASLQAQLDAAANGVTLQSQYEATIADQVASILNSGSRSFQKE